MPQCIWLATGVGPCSGCVASNSCDDVLRALSICSLAHRLLTLKPCKPDCRSSSVKQIPGAIAHRLQCACALEVMSNAAMLCDPRLITCTCSAHWPMTARATESACQGPEYHQVLCRLSIVICHTRYAQTHPQALLGVDPLMLSTHMICMQAIC